MKLCHNCKDKYLPISFNKYPLVLKNNMVVKNLRPSEINIGTHPHNADINIIFSIKELKKGTKIYYWAAEPKPLMKADEISTAEEAYMCKSGKRKNYGCTSVRKDDKISLKLLAPRMYKDEKKIWPKHVHFILKKEGEDDWDKEKVYTALALPINTEKMKSKDLSNGSFITKKLANTNIYITPMQVKKNWKKGKFYMVYALDKKYKSLNDLEEYKNYKHLRLPYDKKLEIPKNIKKSEVLVVYCGKKTCEAAKKLIGKLVEEGHENLFYMEEGMMGFSKESKKIFTS